MKKRRILDNAIAGDKVLNLGETLDYAQANRVVLCYDDRSVVGLFTPGQKLSQPFKRGVYKNRVALGKQLKEGNAQLCQVPLHRQYWRYQGNNTFQCEKCVQLDQSMLINTCPNDKSA